MNKKFNTIYSCNLNEHLKQIKTLEKTIVVYKGFPIEFVLNEVGAEISPFSLIQNNYIIDNKIDLDILKSNKNELLDNLKEVNRQEVKFCFYEELLILGEDLKKYYYGNIVVIENNFFSELFPERYIDVENKYYEELFEYAENPKYVLSKENVLQDFLIEIFKVENSYFVRYIENDLLYDKKINFFETCADFELKKESIVKSNGELIDNEINIFYSFKNYEMQYNLIKLQLEKNIDKKTINLFLDDNYKYVNCFAKELKTFKFVCELNDIDVNICLSKQELFTEGREEIKQILKEYWEFDSFRQLEIYKHSKRSNQTIDVSQEVIIEDIISQVEKIKENNYGYSDIFVTAPTGSGKSLIFQIPSIYLYKKYNMINLIITPLTALMKDQVHYLKQIGMKNCAYINSEQSINERNEVLEQINNDEIGILYISPELLTSDFYQERISNRDIGLCIIDEAHIVTTWGKNFRADYWNLGNILKNKRNKYNFVIVGFTATANRNMITDIEDNLYMKNVNEYISKINCDRISFNVDKYECDSSEYIEKKIEQVKDKIFKAIITNTKTIIYFPYKSQVEQVYLEIPTGILKFAGKYHGSLDVNYKNEVIDKFRSGEIKVILCTKAFGMGIDISDINEVYHYAPTGNLCDYVQEIGRVARQENMQGTASIDFNKKDLKFTDILFELSSIKQYQLKLLLNKVYDLYKHNDGQRSMLVSLDSFSYIFGGVSGNNRDFIQKIKAAFLMIKKEQGDLREGCSFLTAKPKVIAKTKYVAISAKNEKKLLKSKYSEFIKLVSTIEKNRNEDLKNCISTDLGNIYEIDLESIWRNFFIKKNFQEVNKQFYNKTLFTEFEVWPRYKIEYKLNCKYDEIEEIFNRKFGVIEDCLEEVSGKFFSKEEFAGVLNRRLNNKDETKKVVNTILSVFLSKPLWSQGKKRDFTTFLLSKKFKNVTKFSIVNKNIAKSKIALLNEIKKLVDFESEHINKYTTSMIRTDRVEGKTACVLEAFGIANYNVSGGNEAEMLIVINDPNKLKELQNSSYINSILSNLNKQHKEELRILNDFFRKNLTDEERYLYIEKYFLNILENDK